MDPIDMNRIVAELLSASSSGNGRAARTLPQPDGWRMRQTVLALVDSAELAEHESPGEATLQVLAGRVRLRSGGDAWEAGAGQLLIIPERRHSLVALEDSAVLLTVGAAR